MGYFLTGKFSKQSPVPTSKITEATNLRHVGSTVRQPISFGIIHFPAYWETLPPPSVHILSLCACFRELGVNCPQWGTWRRWITRVPQVLTATVWPPHSRCLTEPFPWIISFSPYNSQGSKLYDFTDKKKKRHQIVHSGLSVSLGTGKKSSEIHFNRIKQTNKGELLSLRVLYCFCFP